MSRNLLETLLGAVVLVVAVAFLWYAYRQSDVSQTGGYELRAQFEAIDGLEVGADVRVSGIKVGQVTAQELDPATYLAEVRFTVDPGIELPADSSAAISSTSLLGGKYLSISPGGDEQLLGPGDLITYTQPSINIERLIGQYVFGGGQAGRGGSDAGAADPGTGTGVPASGTDP